MLQSRKAQQYKRAAELLKTFSEKGVPTELQIEAREIERQDQQQHAADLALAADLRKLSSGLPAAGAKVLERARDRSDRRPLPRHPTPFGTDSPRGARPSPSRELADQALFALAMSSYVAGPDHATRELAGGRGDVESPRL